MSTWTVTNPTFTTRTTITSVGMGQNFTDLATFQTASAGQYRVIETATSARTAIGSTANFTAPASASAVLLSAAGSSAGILYIDPADYTFSPGTVQYRLDSWSQTETAPTSSTLTCALYPVASTAAGVVTVGSVVTGSSTVTGAITAANTRTLATGTAFTAPVAGYYIVVFTHSVNPAQTLTYGWTLKARVV